MNIKYVLISALMQRILHGSKMISYESNLCIVVVMINALTSSSTSDNTIARSGMKQSLTINHGKNKFKIAKSQLLHSKQPILQSTKSDQLEAINTYICTLAGDDVHIPIHVEKTKACSNVKH